MEARYWVVTDLETGGLNPDKHDIVQIARVVVDALDISIVPDSHVKAYVKPLLGWDNSSQEALEVHGISRETAEGGLWMSDALGLWSRGIDWSQSVVAAWGIDFELKFLGAAFKHTARVVPYNFRTVDVRSIAHGMRAAEGHQEYLSLKESCRDRGIVFDDDLAHDAMYDAEMTAQLAVHNLRKMRSYAVRG